MLTYWLLAASYQLLGMSFFSSRLPCLIAGALTIWLTWKIAEAMFRRREEAALAALAMFCNFQLLTMSIRATTDIFLLCFIAVSLLGFSRILFAGKRTAWDYLLAYVGAGLATATKGIPGTFPVIFAFLFCLVGRRAGLRCRTLIHWPAMLLGLAVGAFWFVAMVARHGDLAMREFLYDQTEAERGGSRAYPPLNFLAYTEGLLQTVFPWSLMLLVALPRFIKPAREVWAEHKGPILFATGWFALYASVFSFAHVVRTRYLTATCPLLAAAMAPFLARLISDERVWNIPKRFLTAAGVILAVCGLVLVGAGAAWHWKLVAAGAALGGAGFCALYGAPRMSRILHLATLAALYVLIFSVSHVLVRPAVGGNPTVAIAGYIRGHAVNAGRIYTVGLTTRYDSQLRVLLGGTASVIRVPPEQLGEIAGGVAVLSEEHVDAVDRGRFEVVPCGFEYRSIKWNNLREVWRSADRDAAVDKLKKPYYIAIPKG